MGVSIFHLCIFLFFVETSARRLAEEYGEPMPSAPPQPPHAGGANIRPGITIIVAAITTIFTITFILLVYVQHCKTGAFAANSRLSLPLSRVDSGVNKKVIQQLPMFRFSSLRGQKDGLECSVCLTRFEPEEVLRLLPKCRHAFHVECVDTWLDEHSTCPLCRYRVRPEDILLIDCHNSNHKALYNYNHGVADSRRGNYMSPGMFSSRHSSAGERSCALGIGADRLRNESRRRSSFDSRGSRQRSGRMPSFSRRNLSRRDERLAVQANKHRLEHQIVVSDFGDPEEEKSDVKEEEVLFLRTELLLEGGDTDEEEANGNGGSLMDDGRGAVGRRKSKSDGGERRGREREEGSIGKRLLDWIPQFQPKAPANSASSSSV